MSGNKKITFTPLYEQSDYPELLTSNLSSIARKYYRQDFDEQGFEQFVPTDSVSNNSTQVQRDLANLNAGRIRVTPAFSHWDNYYDNPNLYYNPDSGRWEKIDHITGPNGIQSVTPKKIQNGKYVGVKTDASVSLDLNIKSKLLFAQDKGKIFWSYYGYGSWIELTPEKTGEVAFKSLTDYLSGQTFKNKQLIIPGHYEVSPRHYYDLESEFLDPSQTEFKIKGNEIFQDNSGSYQKEFLVALITYGYLEDASQIDLQTGLIVFESKDKALQALNIIFRKDFSKRSSPENQVFFDDESLNITYYVNGQDTPKSSDDVIIDSGWLWKNYDRLHYSMHAKKNPFQGILGNMFQDPKRAQQATYIPILKRGGALGWYNPPEIYTKDGVYQTALHFQLPEGYERPTVEELKEFLQSEDQGWIGVPDVGNGLPATNIFVKRFEADLMKYDYGIQIINTPNMVRSILGEDGNWYPMVTVEAFFQPVNIKKHSHFNDLNNGSEDIYLTYEEAYLIGQIVNQASDDFNIDISMRRRTDIPAIKTKDGTHKYSYAIETSEQVFQNQHKDLIKLIEKGSYPIQFEGHELNEQEANQLLKVYEYAEREATESFNKFLSSHASEANMSILQTASFAPLTMGPIFLSLSVPIIAWVKRKAIRIFFKTKAIESEGVRKPIAKQYATELVNESNTPDFVKPMWKAGNKKPTYYVTDELRDKINLALKLWAKGEPLFITGPTGVGKTQMLTYISWSLQNTKDALVDGIVVPKEIEGMSVFEVDRTALFAGTKYVGEFEERMKLLTYWAKSENHALFFDEARFLIGGGVAKTIDSKGSNDDTLNKLLVDLREKSFRAAFATTTYEYKKYFLGDSEYAAFLRRTTDVRLRAYTKAEVRVMLSDYIAPLLCQEYGYVTVTPDAIERIVEEAYDELPSDQKSALFDRSKKKLETLIEQAVTDLANNYQDNPAHKPAHFEHNDQFMSDTQMIEDLKAKITADKMDLIKLRSSLIQKTVKYTTIKKLEKSILDNEKLLKEVRARISNYFIDPNLLNLQRRQLVDAELRLTNVKERSKLYEKYSQSNTLAQNELDRLNGQVDATGKITRKGEIQTVIHDLNQLYKQREDFLKSCMSDDELKLQKQTERSLESLYLKQDKIEREINDFTIKHRDNFSDESLLDDLKELYERKVKLSKKIAEKAMALQEIQIRTREKMTPSESQTLQSIDERVRTKQAQMESTTSRISDLKDIVGMSPKKLKAEVAKLQKARDELVKEVEDLRTQTDRVGKKIANHQNNPHNPTTPKYGAVIEVSNIGSIVDFTNKHLETGDTRLSTEAQRVKEITDKLFDDPKNPMQRIKGDELGEGYDFLIKRDPHKANHLFNKLIESETDFEKRAIIETLYSEVEEQKLKYQQKLRDETLQALSKDPRVSSLDILIKIMKDHRVRLPDQKRTTEWLKRQSTTDIRIIENYASLDPDNFIKKVAPHLQGDTKLSDKARSQIILQIEKLTGKKFSFLGVAEMGDSDFWSALLKGSTPSEQAANRIAIALNSEHQHSPDLITSEIHQSWNTLKTTGFSLGANVAGGVTAAVAADMALRSAAGAADLDISELEYGVSGFIVGNEAGYQTNRLLHSAGVVAGETLDRVDLTRDNVLAAPVSIAAEQATSYAMANYGYEQGTWQNTVARFGAGFGAEIAFDQAVLNRPAVKSFVQKLIPPRYVAMTGPLIELYYLTLGVRLMSSAAETQGQKSRRLEQAHYVNTCLVPGINKNLKDNDATAIKWEYNSLVSELINLEVDQFDTWINDDGKTIKRELDKTTSHLILKDLALINKSIADALGKKRNGSIDQAECNLRIQKAQGTLWNLIERYKGNPRAQGALIGLYAATWGENMLPYNLKGSLSKVAANSSPEVKVAAHLLGVLTASSSLGQEIQVAKQQVQKGLKQVEWYEEQFKDDPLNKSWVNRIVAQMPKNADATNSVVIQNYLKSLLKLVHKTDYEIKLKRSYSDFNMYADIGRMNTTPVDPYKQQRLQLLKEKRECAAQIVARLSENLNKDNIQAYQKQIQADILELQQIVIEITQIPSLTKAQIDQNQPQMLSSQLKMANENVSPSL